MKAIKRARELFGLTLLEGKQYVDDLKTKTNRFLIFRELDMIKHLKKRPSTVQKASYSNYKDLMSAHFTYAIF